MSSLFFKEADLSVTRHWHHSSSRKEGYTQHGCASHWFAVISFFVPLSVWCSSVNRIHELAFAVASLPSALVCRWSALVSGPHCVREGESFFERLVGQNLWRLESLVERVGVFASSGKADALHCGEELTRVFPGAVFEILLHIGGRIGSAADLDSCSEFFRWLSQTREDEWWHGW